MEPIPKETSLKSKKIPIITTNPPKLPTVPTLKQNLLPLVSSQASLINRTLPTEVASSPIKPPDYLTTTHPAFSITTIPDPVFSVSLLLGFLVPHQQPVTNPKLEDSSATLEHLVEASLTSKIPECLQ